MCLSFEKQRNTHLTFGNLKKNTFIFRKSKKNTFIFQKIQEKPILSFFFAKKKITFIFQKTSPGITLKVKHSFFQTLVKSYRSQIFGKKLMLSFKVIPVGIFCSLVILQKKLVLSFEVIPGGIVCASSFCKQASVIIYPRRYLMSLFIM